jgi:hypothetical protein
MVLLGPHQALLSCSPAHTSKGLRLSVAIEYTCSMGRSSRKRQVLPPSSEA